MDKNRLIGRKNGLPWHLPADFKHFKKTTLNKPIVMGRKTFESIGRPLPNRHNIVVSRSGFTAKGITSAQSIDEALKIAGDVEEVFIVGGSNIYAQTIDKADYLYITHVDAECEGDAWFPAFELADWEIMHKEKFSSDEKNNYNFSIVTYQRKS